MFGLILTLTHAQAAPLALVRPVDSDEWGYIDTTGAFVIQPQYRKAESFEEGFAAIYDKKGKTHGFIDADNTRLQTTPTRFKLKSVLGFGAQGFDEGMTPVQVGKTWGYLDTSGQLAITATYLWASRFEDGVAAVKTDAGFLIIDKTGATTPIAAPAIEVRRFDDDFAPFKNAEKLFGFIDTKGQVAIPATFKAVGYFEDGLAWAKTPESMVGWIDTTGNWVIQPTYLAGKDFEDGVARAKKGDTWVLVTKEGTELSLGDAEGVKDFSEGLAKAKRAGLHGFIDTKGNWAIEPTYAGARAFSEGLAAVKEGELWGYIDSSGKWVIKPAFTAVKDFTE